MKVNGQIAETNTQNDRPSEVEILSVSWWSREKILFCHQQKQEGNIEKQISLQADSMLKIY